MERGEEVQSTDEAGSCVARWGPGLMGAAGTSDCVC